MTVIFADVRGSTAIAENTGPSEFAALLNRFYEVAMSALLPRNAVIDSQYPGVQLEDLEVRGREETFGVHVIRPV